MFTPRLKIAGLVFTLLLLIASGLWLSSGGSPRAQAGEANGSKLKELLKEKLTISQEIASQLTEAYRSGQISFVRVHEAQQAVRNAELDLCDTDKERIAVLEKMLTDAKDYEKAVTREVQAVEAPTSALLKTKVARLDVEIALERAKAR